ncbi:hypothetical protein DXC58_15240 [Ruminococcus sp. TF06-23]|nr:hypothetical protein DXC58_15240 [Ruminococcus sp. TF06-23]
MGFLIIIAKIFEFEFGVGKYQGVKNITCHVRLEAGAIGIVGFLIIIAKIFEFEFGVMIGLIAFVCIVTLILEIITKTV